MATIKDLKFDDKNFNKHTEFGMSLLEKSLRENGAGRSIRLDKDNNIIAGNGIVEAAGQIGLENVKIVEATGDEIIAVKRTDISLNSHKGREMALADNATASADLEWDKDAIADEFDEDEAKGWGVDLDWNDIEEIEEDEAPEVNESEPADSELGKVYQLGEHRLMCGDSTDAGSVAILMDGQKADIAFSSPPYNAGSTPSELKMGKTSKYENDDDNKSESEYRQFLNNYLQNCFDNSEYTFMNIQSLSNNKRALLGVMYDKMGHYADTIIWDKINAQPAMANNVLNSRFEYVHIFSDKANRAIGTIEFRGTIDNVVALPPQRSNEFSGEHNATFSVDFVAWFIKNFAEESVLDSFGGTGTTLIACEQLGRKCYMMELDPKYCDVIRKRYWKFKTGSEEGWQDGTKAISVD